MRRIASLSLSILLFLTVLTSCDLSSINTGKSYDLSEIDVGVTDANRDFAFDIFKALNKEEKAQNIFISPLSISTALTMTYNGAETTTKEAMSKALGYDDTDRSIVNSSYKTLIGYLGSVDKRIELDIANSIWIREGQVIREEFINDNETYFNAQIEAADFSDASAVDNINKWIENATKGKIDKMLEPPIPSDVIMYLINAIYFKGEWSTQFDPDDTRDGSFRTFDGKEKTVEMMYRKGKVEYMESDGYKAVRLPYGNGKTSMYCILPDEQTDIDTFIEEFSTSDWEKTRADITELDDVVLQIPKFKLEYGIKKLNDSLIALGMEEAFDERADFSSIREGIYISRVLHKAVIEVNEEGSEAAAATVVEMTESAAMDPLTFIADRPFLFVICDDTTDTILFMGKYGK